MARKGKSYSPAKQSDGRKQEENPVILREAQREFIKDDNEYQKRALEQGFSPVTSWDKSSFPQIPETINPETAKQELENTFTVSDPTGKQVRFSRAIITHWKDEKKYSESDINGRLERLKMARETVSNPREIWDQGTQRAYVQVFVKKTGGRKGNAVFVLNNGLVRSYHPLNYKELEAIRKGIQIKK